MGTTQRIIPGVTGEPNWGDLSRSINYVVRTVKKEIEEEENDQNRTEEEIARSQRKILDRRNLYIKSVYKNLVKTGGGSRSISSGRSKSIGRAGLRSSKRLVGFISSASCDGLQSALDDIGFGSLVGRSLQDVIDYLIVFSTDSSAGMDETAANRASCEVLNLIAEEAQNDLSQFESILNEYVNGNGLSDILCHYWGHYIFEHLSQRFQEKITQQKGEVVSRETFVIIKDDILGQVRALNETRPVAVIDWKGTEGKVQIESIFGSIINILCDE